ncbi:GNAT family N-acetyltransferase [Chamaesiphon polymorphus]|uniref:GNAT family N-acetyltransferase n=1 Tax=Chamaesiphon polymorphus CCALA 037 TaxID=2107692 RepID=A0A2T1G1P5_9CYAN|nr:GNAT family N-acetyltransferase [Chamaesiphon polymorphus]PSB51147.1 GNAT family N-acetyltransferase [Chamaesiphon polymorphus CCALA 037]
MIDRYQKYIIRDWQPDDRIAAAEVIKNALAEYGLGWEPDGADRDVIDVEKYYLERGGEFWVIEDNGIIIGTSAYYPCITKSSELENPSEKAVEIRKMYLHSKVRGQGLGKYLLGKLERTIFDRGYREIRIETASVLAAAVKLYESNGYVPVTDVETSRCDRAYVKFIDK